MTHEEQISLFEALALNGAYSLFLFLHKKCRPPLTASCSVRSVFRLPV